MIWFSVPLVLMFGLLGGQINKLFRPIGIPLSVIGIFLLAHTYPWWVCLPVLLYAVEMTFGYGEKSLLKRWFYNDGLVRTEYSAFLCLPVVMCAVLTKNYIAIIGILLILVAFQIRTGRLAKIGKYDLLGEDVCRYTAIGIAIAWSLK